MFTTIKNFSFKSKDVLKQILKLVMRINLI